MAWRRYEDPFPAPLREFVESEWPRLPAECLGSFGCHGQGYEVDCQPRAGEYCGERSYEMIERDHPGDASMLARWLRADAYKRWHQARLGWVKDDPDAWMDEFCSSQEHRIRYGRLW